MLTAGLVAQGTGVVLNDCCYKTEAMLENDNKTPKTKTVMTTLPITISFIRWQLSALVFEPWEMQRRVIGKGLVFVNKSTSQFRLYIGTAVA